MGDEDKEGQRRSNISISSSSSRSRAMENLSLKMENYPRDLLQRFMSSSSDAQQSQHAEHHQEQEEPEEEIELNLGLSLGGRFGIDKHANKLMRSSSIVGTMPLVREDESMTPPPATYPTLLRTSSLPTETEEEWRKRKELQTLRRMEAKRRRSEKQRIFKTEREGGGGGGVVLDEEKREVMESATMALNRFGSSTVAPPFGLPSWAASTRQLVLGDVLAKGKVGGAGFRGFLGQPSSQGSVDNSQGGSSLGMSEMDSKPFRGSGSFGEARSPASVQSLQEQSSLDATGGSSETRTNEDMRRNSRADQVENPSRRSHPSQKIGREIGANSMEDMPCVFTKGDGPNGRRIEGILYKYGKGEEVRIMCVCHGNFLSPAEFVKHAGGGDVAHPLKHIVVDLSATPFL